MLSRGLLADEYVCACRVKHDGLSIPLPLKLIRGQKPVFIRASSCNLTSLFTLREYDPHVYAHR
jgi:hypothetical protein